MALSLAEELLGSSYATCLTRISVVRLFLDLLLAPLGLIFVFSMPFPYCFRYLCWPPALQVPQRQ